LSLKSSAVGALLKLAGVPAEHRKLVVDGLGAYDHFKGESEMQKYNIGISFGKAFKALGIGAVSVAAVGFVGYFSDANVIKALADAGVNGVYVIVAVPVIHGIVEFAANWLKNRGIGT
jgi:hypothetical protein